MADQSGNDGRADRPWPPRLKPPAPSPLCRRAGAMKRPTTGSRRRRMRSIPSNTRRRSRMKIGRPRSMRSTPSLVRRSARILATAPDWQDQQPVEQPAEQRNYLAAHAVEKSFGDRKVVKGASLYVRRGEAVGSARTERRRQDHDLLHDHRADRGRPRPHRARRPRRHHAADVPARAARHRLSAAGGLDLPRPHRRGKHPRRARSGRAEQAPPRARSRRAARRVQHHAGCASRRRSRCPAASAGAARSRARWRRGRTTCCSTSRSPASIRSRSATCRFWCAT